MQSNNWNQNTIQKQPPIPFRPVNSVCILWIYIETLAAKSKVMVGTQQKALVVMKKKY